MAGNLVISQINGGPIGVINAIINGNFQVNQRGVSGTVTLAAGVYGHDRWKAGASGATYTFATTNNVTVLTISAGSLIQVIEGANLYDGTYALSFSGTAQGKIGAGSFAASGVTGTAVGGTNLNIEFNTGTLSLVQFEPGTQVSPFERRDIGRELILCQRYGISVYSESLVFGYLNVANTWSPRFAMPVQMRATPTVTVLGSGGMFASNDTTNNIANLTPTITLLDGSQYGVRLSISGMAGGTANSPYGGIYYLAYRSFAFLSAEL